jgi:hypothetical protein
MGPLTIAPPTQGSNKESLANLAVANHRRRDSAGSIGAAVHPRRGSASNIALTAQHQSQPAIFVPSAALQESSELWACAFCYYNYNKSDSRHCALCRCRRTVDFSSDSLHSNSMQSAVSPDSRDSADSLSAGASSQLGKTSKIESSHWMCNYCLYQFNSAPSSKCDVCDTLLSQGAPHLFNVASAGPFPSSSITSDPVAMSSQLRIAKGSSRRNSADLSGGAPPVESNPQELTAAARRMVTSFNSKRSVHGILKNQYDFVTFSCTIYRIH